MVTGGEGAEKLGASRRCPRGSDTVYKSHCKSEHPKGRVSED